MALALVNPESVYMPLNKETKPILQSNLTIIRIQFHREQKKIEENSKPQQHNIDMNAIS